MEGLDYMTSIEAFGAGSCWLGWNLDYTYPDDSMNMAFQRGVSNVRRTNDILTINRPCTLEELDYVLNFVQSPLYNSIIVDPRFLLMFRYWLNQQIF